MFISEDEAREILRPHEPRVSTIMDQAWKTLSGMKERPSLNLKRTVATVMHNFMMNELRAEYAGESSVHLIEEHETIRMLIDRRLVARIKKMDRRGVTRAQPTQAALGFIEPDAPLCLPFASDEVPPSTPAVDMGYVLNEMETRIDQKLVAARNGDAVLWSYTFERATPAADAMLIPAPTPPTSPSTIIKVPTDRLDRKKTRD